MKLKNNKLLECFKLMEPYLERNDGKKRSICIFNNNGLVIGYGATYLAEENITIMIGKYQIIIIKSEYYDNIIDDINKSELDQLSSQGAIYFRIK